MTSFRALRAASLALALAAAGTAAASDARAERLPSTYEEFTRLAPLDAMHMMDKAEKGYVTRKEFLDFQEKFFSRMDKDRDGKISKAEWTDQG